MRQVVGAAIVANGRVLAAQRGPGMSAAGVWEFPGGKLEPGESESQALVRELREELHLRILPMRRLGAVERPERRLRLTVWICRKEEGDPVLVEHAAVRWVGPEELEELGWAEPDRPFLTELRAVLLDPEAQ